MADQEPEQEADADELSGSGKLTLPETRTGKDGKIRPTTYAKRELPKKHGQEDLTEDPERMEAEERGKDAPKPGAAVPCTGGCGRLVSQVYLEDLEAGDGARTATDWTKVYDDWYCPACLEVWKEESNKKAEKIKDEIMDLAAIIPCGKCEGRASVQVNRYNWTARITCMECGQTTGYHDPPHSAILSWKAGWEERLKKEACKAKEEAEKACGHEECRRRSSWVHIVEKDGPVPVLVAPCPVCGEEPTVYEMDPDAALETGWVVECSGCAHRFRVYGRDEIKAVDMWNKVFQKRG